MKIRGFFVIRYTICPVQHLQTKLGASVHTCTLHYTMQHHQTRLRASVHTCAQHLHIISSYATSSDDAGRKCPHLRSTLAHYITLYNIIRRCWSQVSSLAPYFNKFSFPIFPFSDHNPYFCQKRSNEKSNAHNGTGIGLSLLYLSKYNHHYDRFAEKLETDHQYL